MTEHVCGRRDLRSRARGRLLCCVFRSQEIVSLSCVFYVARASGSMGRCCVPMCRGNYDGGPKVRLFSFPKDPKRRDDWKRAVRRDDVDVAQLKDPKVCERHFKPQYLRTTSTYTDVDGRTIEAPMKLTRLTADALPTIFPDCPAYVSDMRKTREAPGEKRRRTENELLQHAIQQSKVTYEAESQENKVQSLLDITSSMERTRNKVFWSPTVCESCVIFAHVEITSQAPEIVVSVVVTSDLSVSVFLRNVQLFSSEELCIPSKIFDFRVLIDLLDSVETYSSERPIQKQDKVQGTLNLVVSLLDDITNEDLEESERADALLFLKEQCHLVTRKANAVRYSSDLLVFSSILHTISPHAYKFFRHSGKLVLPHPETVKRVCAACDVSPSKEQSEEGFLRFIKRRAGILKQHERNVSLMLDEIHLQQFFEFKGGCLTGSAAHSAEPAKTAHVFMVQSLLSTYKDVVHILPVTRISANELHDVLKRVIMSLESAGLHVVAVITDNNAINRKMMSLFGNGKEPDIVYPHPANSQQPLFYVVDTVHLLKCVRNNWINQKDDDKCFHYPSFESDRRKRKRPESLLFLSATPVSDGT
ncbi:uncharacterized protein LOC144162976 [Haemaphysalis longicornis]